MALKRGKIIFHILCLRKQVVYDTLEKLPPKAEPETRFSCGYFILEAFLRSRSDWVGGMELSRRRASRGHIIEVALRQWGLKSTRTSQEACRIPPRIVYLDLLAPVVPRLRVASECCACMADRALTLVLEKALVRTVGSVFLRRYLSSQGESELAQNCLLQLWPKS